MLRTRIAVRATLAAATFIVLRASPAMAGGLNGSHSSMVHQHAVAVGLDYTFTNTPAQLERLVADSALQPVAPNADFTLDGVSYPYARAEVRDFIERFAAEYHAATGAPLVVTSLTRPTSSQPRNASPLSVHPAGMAVDLRVPADDHARNWLEHALLALETQGVLDVTREHHPSHLHVAVFPEAFRAYAAKEDSLHPRVVPAAATPDSVAGQRDTVVTTASAPAPGNPALPIALLLGLDAAMAGGIIFAVRRSTNAAD